MSTDYKPIPAINFDDIERADFKVGDVHVTVAPSKEARRGEACCLTDGENYVWAWVAKGEEPGDPYSKTYFSRYGANNPTDILGAIMAHFRVDMVSEHDEEYWNEKT